jgi:hypothetical protein
VLEVIWAGTAVPGGRFSPIEVRSTPDELDGRFRELRPRGEGNLEVRLPDRDFPTISLGFRGGHAVIHRVDSPESMSLLRGDSSVPSDAAVEVLIMDEPAEFTGDFVVAVDHAWRLIKEFVHTNELVNLGEWCEL